MILYIIRHAQSTNNALGNPEDRECDPALTDLGRRQAQLLALLLAGGAAPDFEMARALTPDRRGFGIARLFVSPMRRALQTAQPIARALGVTPEVWVEIHEHGGVYLDHGPVRGVVGYPGLTRAAMLAELPGCVLPPGVGEQGWWCGGREDQTACDGRAARVAAALRELAAGSAPEARVAVISHGAFIDALLKALLRPAVEPECYFMHFNTAVSRLDLGANGEVGLGYLNRTDHLPPDMLT